MKPSLVTRLGGIALCLVACSDAESDQASSATGGAGPAVTGGTASKGGESGDPGTGGRPEPHGEGGADSGGSAASGGAAVPSVTGGAPSGGAAGSAAAQPGGPVVLDGVFNARQPGSLVTPGGKQLKAGVILRSGDLYGLTGVGCAQLQALGIRSIIDLRDATDRSASPDAECTSSGRDYWPIELPKILPPSQASYLETLIAAEPELSRIFAVLAGDNALPVLIHCVIGRDRASLITALVLLAVDVPESLVLEDMVENQEASVVVQAAWMDGVLARIAEQGGIEAYLSLHGVDPVTLVALRASMLE